MKILLTGAEGFTGRHFAGEALSRGFEVDCLQSNLLDPVNALAQELQTSSPDFLLHLGAASFVADKQIEKIYDTNVMGTINLLQAVTELEKKPKKIVVSSNANIYGNTTNSPISEEQPSAVQNHYAASKAAMEQALLVYGQSLPLVVARPFNYTGVGQKNIFLIPKLVEHFKLELPSIDLGNTYVEREFNDIEFVVHSYFLLLGFGLPGEVYNICSGKPYKINQVIELLQQLTGHKLLVNKRDDLVRTDELSSLYGDPSKLFDLGKRSGVHLPAIAIEETLRRMLV